MAHDTAGTQILPKQSTYVTDTAEAALISNDVQGQWWYIFSFATWLVRTLYI